MKFHRMPPKSCSLCGRASLLQVWGYSLEDLKVAHIQVGWLRQSSVSQVGFVQRYIYTLWDLFVPYQVQEPNRKPTVYNIYKWQICPYAPKSIILYEYYEPNGMFTSFWMQTCRPPMMGPTPINIQLPFGWILNTGVVWLRTWGWRKHRFESLFLILNHSSLGAKRLTTHLTQIKNG